MTIEEKVGKAVIKQISKENIEKRNTDHSISFIVNGSARVKQGDDYEQVISTRIPYDAIVSVLLNKLNGVTIESVLREVLNGDIDGSDIKKEAKAAMKKIKGTAKRNCSGKTSIKDIDLSEFIINSKVID